MIGRVLALIPTPYKVLLGAAVVAAIVLGLIALHSSIYDAGYDAAVAEYQEKVRVAKEQARAEIIKSGEAYDKLLAEIAAASDGEVPVGPVTSRTIDRLP